jgi:peptidoglycan/LPS O-acetylase OafA/YrhL
MKKTVILFIIAALVLLTVGFWFFSGSMKVGLLELMNIGIVVLIVVFALFMGYKRLSAHQKGEPAEDEMSKKVIGKTSSMSYYISIYLWLVISYFSDRLPYETHTIIGIGIVGMAVTFALCWLYFNFRGIRNE